MAIANLAEAKKSLDDLDEQYLTFRLNDQDYGIPILEVQEIKGMTEITPIPNSPVFIKGVINLRGTVVPIIDLRLRFNIEAVEYDDVTVIIVVNISSKLAGLVVDSVSDVMNASTEQRSEAPEFEGQVNRKFIDGLVRYEDRLVILLDIDRLADADEMEVGDDIAETGDVADTVEMDLGEDAAKTKSKKK